MAKKKENTSILTLAAGLVAGAAGAYYLYGTNEGTKTRKAIKGWSLKMKGEVLDRLENMKNVNEEVYHQVVDKVQKKYSTAKKVDQVELGKLTKELKTHWKNIKGELMATKPVVKK